MKKIFLSIQQILFVTRLELSNDFKRDILLFKSMIDSILCYI